MNSVDKPRCDVSYHGIRCMTPADHEDSHQNGATRWPTWQQCKKFHRVTCECPCCQMYRFRGDLPSTIVKPDAAPEGDPIRLMVWGDRDEYRSTLALALVTIARIKTRVTVKERQDHMERLQALLDELHTPHSPAS